jgi:hypothetical protein
MQPRYMIVRALSRQYRLLPAYRDLWGLKGYEDEGI